jgi:G3E family GTPase
VTDVDTSALLVPAPRFEAVDAPACGKVPVTLLTGFLGAGKTTLLNRILSGDHGLRVGVLVNDFGAINIDAALVESVEENTISLVNGCVCCEVRDDLVASLEELLQRVETVDYVILEASGVADPGGIVMTFLDWKYRDLLVLDSITCVVDAEAVFRDADDDYLTGLKLRQIAFADLVLLNKTDLVTPQHVEVVREWIGAHLERISVVETVRGEAPLDVLLGAGRFDPSRVETASSIAEGARHGDDGAAFERWSSSTEELFDRARLEQMVRRELPGSVYRCKGIVRLVDDPDRSYALQVVGRRTELTPVPGGDPATSHVVAIGRDLAEAGLDELFDRCRAVPDHRRGEVPAQATGCSATTHA